MAKKVDGISFPSKIGLSLKRIIDISFFRGLFSQLVILLLLFLIVLASGSIIYNKLTASGAISTCDNAYFSKGIIWSLIHATDPGYLGSDYSPEQMKLFWLGLIVTLSGWFILSGFIMTIFINYYQNHLDRIIAGKVRYYFWVKHRLIFGWDQMGASVVEQLFKENKSPVIILSLTPTTTIQKDIEKMIRESTLKSRSLNNRIYIYEGSFTSKGELLYHNFDKTDKVIILGDQSINDQNVRNIQAVIKINDILETSQRRERITCYVNLPDLRSYDLLQDVDLDVIDKIDFRPFNFYEDWARRLWSILPKVKNGKLESVKEIYNYKPLAYRNMSASSTANVHLVIVGFGLMGQALAAQAARICHYANGQKTKISVFDDKCGDKVVDEFLSHFFLGEIPDIDFNFYSEAIESQTGRDLLKSLSTSSNEITTIAICISNSDLAMSTALSLPKELLLADIPILIWQETHSGMNDLADRLLKEKQWKDLRFFGMLTECFGLDERLDQLARQIHENYRKISGNPSIKPWEELPERLRWANRYQADTFSELLRSSGYKFVYAQSGLKPVELSNIEWLSEREHDRWMAEKLIAGWTQADLTNCNSIEEIKETRDDLRLIHYFLVPYSELDNIMPGTKQKDRDVIENIQKLLRSPVINLALTKERL